ncbi:50S ribosomal protein L9 [Candidatus Phycosocius spiralis]|uniref:Large ribosomal subunit protein bL9 n=1 Tax=Candidatus Phycosocius spiralis TaxID=2815099 RepID=A0ABQ4PX48_9PROT|nr:50S ribosomal protein L9 [Candidatus Phycosocius spiralis]GIU67248.1 50S ribosomal protein L9 [Candidatus Phycosocius spiralis]
MDIILLERVGRLGGIGDIVSVKPGYARNFLLPQKKALRATEANKKLFELQRVTLETRNAEARSAAESAAKTLTGQIFLLIRAAGESGQLYGSVAARDIAEAAAAAGFTIGRNQVQLDAPIKTIGFQGIKIRLHPEVEVEVFVNVARTPDEAERQAKGENVINSQFDEDRLAAAEQAAEIAENAVQLDGYEP